MKITLITVGKIKEKYLKDAIDEYMKRLSKYCKTEIIEVPDEKCADSLSPKEETMVKNKEGERIILKIPQSHVIALELGGKEFTSVEFADLFSTLAVKGISHITFIIGGSLGLSESVLNKKNMGISFSKMTFPHQLMRVIFLEQLYRAFKINSGETYHK